MSALFDIDMGIALAGHGPLYRKIFRETGPYLIRVYKGLYNILVDILAQQYQGYIIVFGNQCSEGYSGKVQQENVHGISQASLDINGLHHKFTDVGTRNSGK